MATLNADISAPSLVSLVPWQQEESRVQADNHLESVVNYTKQTVSILNLTKVIKITNKKI